MLITTHPSSSTASSSTLKKQPPKPQESLDNLYHGGSWDLELDDMGYETYLQGRKSTVNLVQEFKSGKASYRKYAEGGDFKTLSPEQKKERLAQARDAGIKSGMEVAAMIGMTGLMGAGVMAVVGEVGSLLSTMSGGSGIPSGFIGLGAIAVTAGVGGLISGLSTYFGEKNQSKLLASQSGTVKATDNGFEFHPDSKSSNSTPVHITQTDVNELAS